MPRVCIRQWQRVVVVSDDLYQLMAQNLPLKKSIRINLYCYSSNSDAILGGEGRLTCIVIPQILMPSLEEKV